MVEETNARKCHGDTVAIAGLNDLVIANGSARFRDIRDTALSRSFNVIAEGEEGIRGERDAVQRIEPLTLLFPRERFRLDGKYAFPASVPQQILTLLTDVDIDCIIAIGALYIRAEGKV